MYLGTVVRGNGVMYQFLAAGATGHRTDTHTAYFAFVSHFYSPDLSEFTITLTTYCIGLAIASKYDKY